MGENKQHVQNAHVNGVHNKEQFIYVANRQEILSNVMGYFHQ